jgi:V-type H+-transporting ATPase subunit H
MAAPLAARFEVNWGSMTMAGLMDQDECSIVQRFQQMSEAEIHDSISGEPDSAKELGPALVRLVHVTGNAPGVGLACALSAIVLAGGRERVGLFVGTDGSLPVQNFFRVLEAEVEGAELEVCTVLGHFLSVGTPKQVSNFSFESLVDWLSNMIKIGTSVQRNNIIGLQCTCALFKSRQFRLRCIEKPVVSILCNYLAQNVSEGLSSEVLYRATFSVWTLSFHDEAVPALCKGNVTTHIIQKNLPHVDDKISRLGLATLVNLLNKEDVEQGVALNDVMVEANIVKALFDLSVRKWTAKDEKDVNTDIARLNKVLSSKFSSMNSFERYMAELTTGFLKAGPMHSDKFWSENANRFEYKDHLAIRLLVNLLVSEDATTVALACADLGEFARFCNGGKKIIQHYKGKGKIMALMASENTEIQKAALKASAKLLITNWEHV